MSRARLEPTADGGGTLVGWNQDSENPDVGRRMERILVPANEQLLDRLSAEVYANMTANKALQPRRAWALAGPMCALKCG